VLSPVGNRVSVFDLVKSVIVPYHACANNQLTHFFHSNKSHTFPFQTRKNIAAIALSPNANILITVDEGAVNALPVFIASAYALMIQMGGLSSLTSVGVLSFTISISRSRSMQSSFRRMDRSLLSHTNRRFRSGRHRTTSYASSPRLICTGRIQDIMMKFSI